MICWRRSHRVSFLSPLVVGSRSKRLSLYAPPTLDVVAVAMVGPSRHRIACIAVLRPLARFLPVVGTEGVGPFGFEDEWWWVGHVTVVAKMWVSPLSASHWAWRDMLTPQVLQRGSSSCLFKRQAISPAFADDRLRKGA